MKITKCTVCKSCIYFYADFHLQLKLFCDFTSSIFSVHSSTNLSTHLLLHLQSSSSKYSPIFHDLLHSHSQLLGFQINPVLHRPLSINFLPSHLHLFSFHLCLFLQTLASNLHLHLRVSCHFMCLFSLVLIISYSLVIH